MHQLPQHLFDAVVAINTQNALLGEAFSLTCSGDNVSNRWKVTFLGHLIYDSVVERSVDKAATGELLLFRMRAIANVAQKAAGGIPASVETRPVARTDAGLEVVVRRAFDRCGAELSDVAEESLVEAITGLCEYHEGARDYARLTTLKQAMGVRSSKLVLPKKEQAAYLDKEWALALDVVKATFITEPDSSRLSDDIVTLGRLKKLTSLDDVESLLADNSIQGDLRDTVLRLKNTVFFGAVNPTKAWIEAAMHACVIAGIHPPKALLKEQEAAVAVMRAVEAIITATARRFHVQLALKPPTPEITGGGSSVWSLADRIIEANRPKDKPPGGIQTTLPPDLQEALGDILTHRHDFTYALEVTKAVARNDKEWLDKHFGKKHDPAEQSDPNDYESYWKHQQSVLDRIHDAALAFLRNQNREQTYRRLSGLQMVRGPVVDFAVAMEQRLQLHDTKKGVTGWRNGGNYLNLFTLASDALCRAHRDIGQHPRETARGQLLDVANLLMMAWDLSIREQHKVPAPIHPEQPASSPIQPSGEEQAALAGIVSSLPFTPIKDTAVEKKDWKVKDPYEEERARVHAPYPSSKAPGAPPVLTLTRDTKVRLNGFRLELEDGSAVITQPIFPPSLFQVAQTTAAKNEDPPMLDEDVAVCFAVAAKRVDGMFQSRQVPDRAIVEGVRAVLAGMAPLRLAMVDARFSAFFDAACALRQSIGISDEMVFVNNNGNATGRLLRRFDEVLKETPTEYRIHLVDIRKLVEGTHVVVEKSAKAAEPVVTTDRARIALFASLQRFPPGCKVRVRKVRPLAGANSEHHKEFLGYQEIQHQFTGEGANPELMTGIVQSTPTPILTVWDVPRLPVKLPGYGKPVAVRIDEMELVDGGGPFKPNNVDPVQRETDAELAAAHEVLDDLNCTLGAPLPQRMQEMKARFIGALEKQEEAGQLLLKASLRLDEVDRERQALVAEIEQAQKAIDEIKIADATITPAPLLQRVQSVAAVVARLVKDYADEAAEAESQRAQRKQWEKAFDSTVEAKSTIVEELKALKLKVESGVLITAEESKEIQDMISTMGFVDFMEDGIVSAVGYVLRTVFEFANRVPNDKAKGVLGKIAALQDDAAQARVARRIFDAVGWPHHTKSETLETWQQTLDALDFSDLQQVGKGHLPQGDVAFAALMAMQVHASTTLDYARCEEALERGRKAVDEFIPGTDRSIKAAHDAILAALEKR